MHLGRHVLAAGLSLALGREVVAIHPGHAAPPRRTQTHGTAQLSHELRPRPTSRTASPRRAMARDRLSRAKRAPAGRLLQRPRHGFESLTISGDTNQPQDRQLTVYLPQGYGDDPTRAYPVIYMQDGQNLFEYGPMGFGNGWEVASAMEAEVAAGRAEPAIIVGIFNSPDRLSEYGTVSRTVGSGGDAFFVESRADHYVDYVADVVRPEIERRYLVRKGRDAAAIGGSSMGGLVSIHGAIRRPDVFGKVLASSPSLWFDKAIIARAAANPAPIDLYIDNGGVGAEGDNAPYVAALRDAMERKPTAKGRVFHWFDPSAGHTEGAWRERFPRAFSAIFPAHRP